MGTRTLTHPHILAHSRPVGPARQIKVKRVHYKDGKGPTVARFQAEELHDREDFVMQVLQTWV